jgi:hypothetical protein
MRSQRKRSVVIRSHPSETLHLDSAGRSAVPPLERSSAGSNGLSSAGLTLRCRGLSDGPSWAASTGLWQVSRPRRLAGSSLGQRAARRQAFGAGGSAAYSSRSHLASGSPSRPDLDSLGRGRCGRGGPGGSDRRMGCVGDSAGRVVVSGTIPRLPNRQSPLHAEGAPARRRPGCRRLGSWRRQVRDRPSGDQQASKACSKGPVKKAAAKRSLKKAAAKTKFIRKTEKQRSTSPSRKS